MWPKRKPTEKETVERNRVRSLYQEGLSTREIAALTGHDAAWVYRICADIARPHAKPESTHWRTNRNRARSLMERHLGRKLESFEVVHHINENYTDNRLENLQVMTRSEHARHHFDQGKSSMVNVAEYKRAWREKNRDRINASMRDWRSKRKAAVTIPYDPL